MILKSKTQGCNWLSLQHQAVLKVHSAKPATKPAMKSTGK